VTTPHLLPDENTTEEGVTAFNVMSALVKAVLLAALGYTVVHIGAGFFASHKGPTRMQSLGVARFDSCSYRGEFVGGAGFDCLVKNHSSNEIRVVSDSRCASFDVQGRLIGSPEQVISLYSQTMQPNEERIVRVYGALIASRLVCSENGDIVPPSRLSSAASDLAASHLLSDFPL